MPDPYPRWKFYPSHTREPSWVAGVLAAFAAARASIESSAHIGLTSDKALAELRPYLESVGFQIETGKTKAEKIRRPVFFGDEGREGKTYEIDGFHDELAIALEVEAGRGARGNAVYRDLIESSLLVDTRYLVLAVMIGYRHNSGGESGHRPQLRGCTRPAGCRLRQPAAPAAVRRGAARRLLVVLPAVVPRANSLQLS